MASAAVEILRRLSHQPDLVAVRVGHERQPQVVPIAPVADLGPLPDNGTARLQEREGCRGVVYPEVDGGPTLDVGPGDGREVGADSSGGAREAKPPGRRPDLWGP
ncbi:MAG: hypothetical protein EPO36_10255 [Chloroflexota bacterium]|nr:MAG: hypothetical protein EPO36_10255 [Chloroflexota bacterium]